MQKATLIFVLFLIVWGGTLLAQARPDPKSVKKRDPFVDLVDASGRIKTEDELFQSAQRILPATITLKGIIWDKKRPLAVINGKVYGEGAQVAAGLILEKINVDSVVLRAQDNQRIKIDLKKKEKK